MAYLNNIKRVKTEKWFFFILLYLFVDYGRPQDLVPIGAIKPGLIVILILTYFLTLYGFKLGNSKQIKIIWYFVLLTAIFIPFAENNYWAFQTFRNMVSYMPFIISVVLCVNTIKRLKILVNVFIILMIYISLYSLTHDGIGSGNYFQDENDVSLFINMWLPFCFFLFLNEKEFIKKTFYALGMIVGLSAVVVSFSRGGFVGLVCATVVIWLFSNKKMISLVIIGLFGIVVYFSSSESYRAEMATITNQHEGTAEDRLLSWATAWDMFLDNPLGVGGNNFQTRFPEYQGDRFERGMWGRVAHSLWFTLIPELGVFGIILYFRLLYFNIKDLFFLKKINIRDNQDHQYLYILSLSAIASLAGFFASATFISVLYYPHYWYLTAIIVVAREMYDNCKTGENLQDIRKINKNMCI